MVTGVVRHGSAPTREVVLEDLAGPLVYQVHPNVGAAWYQLGRLLGPAWESNGGESSRFLAVSQIVQTLEDRVSGVHGYLAADDAFVLRELAGALAVHPEHLEAVLDCLCGGG